MKVELKLSMDEYPDLSNQNKADLLQEIIEHMNHTYSLGMSVMVIESEE
ncbi:hypothetical protein BigBertha_164 [Bacillus phage BigBertha]|uniref:WHIM1 domain-containing protein n=6 Tax=Bequatrovirus TaxID=1917990 RepID=A0A7U3T8T1_9CAUD|nr:hypothetical protein TROLL_171 [Bacillus phage Troll]YP_008771191.1 hypothetical protein BigBertha_164 [Bacillus phage BigBertha]YP_009055930.1 hypothetical protein LD11_gp165 [Bacillus phage Riley]YP_009206525.1 hypothetical protein AVV02_gp170 [Bacillus phage AvesoBmore]YP_009290043.1 hypothetical protein BI003_gp164 [Bacillus phage Phrodo]ASZ75897.1 hypothetical protein TAFFO16_164 [Bacillus phage Taffo16]QPY77401.1 hypothetical protein ANTHOS_165 [Bacillus phage Anthos]UGO48976.1 hypo